MGAVAHWIGTLLANIFGYFGVSLAKKTAWATAAITASLALGVALAAAIKLLLANIVYVLPAWAAGGAIFLPSNLAICISAVMSAKFFVWVYRWNLTNLKIIATIN